MDYILKSAAIKEIAAAETLLQWQNRPTREIQRKMKNFLNFSVLNPKYSHDKGFLYKR